MYRLLLVCTGNTCRSVMLESFIKHQLKQLGKKAEVRSVGLRVVEGEGVHEDARRALKKKGLTTRHKPKQIEAKDLERADTIITMTQEQKEYLRNDKCFYKVYSLAEVVGFNVSDPYCLGQDVYDQCANMLSLASFRIVENLDKAGKI